MTLAQGKMRSDIQFYSLVYDQRAGNNADYKPKAALTAAKRSNFSHVNNSTSRV